MTAHKLRVEFSCKIKVHATRDKGLLFLPIILFLFRLACRCAKKTSDTGYSYFGLQFYGECWSDRLAEKRYERYGKSPDCMGFQYKRCNDEDENECVGGGNENYMYKIVGGKQNKILFSCQKM